MKNLKISRLLAALGGVVLASACATAPEAAAAPAADTAAAVQAEAAPAAAPKSEAKPAKTSGGHSKNDFFATYDVDGDGVVTRADFITVRDEGFDERDGNRDGDVIDEEYVAEYTARLDADLAATRKGQIAQAWVRFGVLDTNKDGVISREEFQESGIKMFDNLDTNKDGIVDSNDTKSAY